MQRFVKPSAPCLTLKTPCASSKLARSSSLELPHSLHPPQSPVVVPTGTAPYPKSLLRTLTLLAAPGLLIPPRHSLGVRKAFRRSSSTRTLTSSKPIPLTPLPRYPGCSISSNSSYRSSRSTKRALIRWQSYTKQRETKNLARMPKASESRARGRSNFCNLLSSDTRICTS